MKRKFINAFFLLPGLFAFASIANAQRGGTEISLGSTIPMVDHDMLNVDNASLSIGEVKGRLGTVVVFWCNTCPWVEKYESRMITIARDYGADFGFIAINPNDPIEYPAESMERMKERAGGYTFPYVADRGSRVASAFGAARTPQVFLFDANDILVYTGGIDNNPNDSNQVDKPYLIDNLNHIKNGSVDQINPAKTRAFGCTIKWQTD